MQKVKGLYQIGLGYKSDHIRMVNSKKVNGFGRGGELEMTLSGYDYYLQANRVSHRRC